MDFPSGLGVSVISAQCEELIYASLLGLRFSLDRCYPGSSPMPSSASSEVILPGVECGREIEEDDDINCVEDDAVFVMGGGTSTLVNSSNDVLLQRCQRGPIEQARLRIERIQVRLLVNFCNFLKKTRSILFSDISLLRISSPALFNIKKSKSLRLSSSPFVFPYPVSISVDVLEGSCLKVSLQEIGMVCFWVGLA